MTLEENAMKRYAWEMKRTSHRGFRPTEVNARHWKCALLFTELCQQIDFFCWPRRQIVAAKSSLQARGIILPEGLRGDMHATCPCILHPESSFDSSHLS